MIYGDNPLKPKQQIKGSDLIAKRWLSHRFCARSAVKHDVSSRRFRGANQEAVNRERFFTLQNGSLQIIRAEKEDSGKYVCVASNTEGKAAVTAVLDVKGTGASCTSSANEGPPSLRGLKVTPLTCLSALLSSIYY